MKKRFAKKKQVARRAFEHLLPTGSKINGRGIRSKVEKLVGEGGTGITISVSSSKGLR